MNSSLKMAATSATAILFLALAPASLHATPITYNLTLTANSGSLYSGTGSITLDNAPLNPGYSSYTGSDVMAFDVMIDHQTFNLTNGSISAVSFLNGGLTDITYSGSTGANPMRFALMSTASYVFSYNNLQSSSIGTFSASVAPTAVTPEPGSLFLLATGLIGGAGALRRRLSAARLG